jgi:ketosteroid isomerase-like protein
MDRTSVEQVIRDGYAARLRGDVDVTCQSFSDDASFTIAGSPEASPVASSVRGCGNIRDALAGLMGAFEFLHHDFLDVLVEGDRAAVHSRARLRATATGEEVETDFVDLVTVRDGKIESFVQFCDTALAGKLVGGGPSGQDLPR